MSLGHSVSPALTLGSLLALEMYIADVPSPGCSTFSRPSLVAGMHCTVLDIGMHCVVHQCVQWGLSTGATSLGAAILAQ